MRLFHILSLLIVFFLSTETAFCRDLYSLINNGHLKEASDSLSKYSSASKREGRLLFFQALLEKNADESARLMLAALEVTTPSRFKEVIYYRLALYYIQKRNLVRSSSYVSGYLKRWESGKYEIEMLRMAALIAEREKKIDEAKRHLDRVMVRHKKESSLAEFDRARLLSENRRNEASKKILRRLSGDRSSDAAAMSLYLLGIDAADRGRVDDAVFYYNLFREAYPFAVGLDDLTERLGGMSLDGNDTRAEEITGTFYSVQVGVFSDGGNAKRFSERFKSYDKKIDIKRKTISGKKYRVIYVGRFQSFDEANAFKRRLQLIHNEVFQVVAR